MGPAARAWFERAFAAPTRVQAEGWAAIARDQDALLIAPTGSGKTLAAFLVALDRIGSASAPTTPGWRALYVSPLKALVYDVERNLGTPLRGIGVVAAQRGLPFRSLTVDVRTGDTPQAERRRMAERPGDILVTTPESLFLLMLSEARRHLLTVETLIVDEIHAIAPTKRGAHTMLTIERLADMITRETPRRLQRIGLSATVRPASEIARFLSGGRPCTIIDAAEPPRIDLEIGVPVDDMTKPWTTLAEAPLGDDERSGSLLGVGGRDLTPQERTSMWPAIEPRILELIAAHRSTIVFVNARGLAERLAERLNSLAIEAGIARDDGPALVRAHHGSVAHAQRREMEEALKAGQLRGIVATSSLELGIDMGAVDLVVQVESPDSAARGLQRVGRAGHQVGEVSIGKIFPKHRGDLVEATVVAGLMREGRIEALTIPKNPLDVLAQHVVAMCATTTWKVADVLALVRRVANFHELSDDVFIATLDMLTGRFPSNEVADLRPRINWNRADDTLVGRKGARLLVATNAGTIPDRGLYGVFLAGQEGEGKKARRVGELDEEMVHEARVGETFMLGASTWRIQEITRDRVMVTPAPGEPGKMPFWHGDGPGRPVETGRALGAFVRDIGEREDADADRVLATRYPLDARARKNLIAYIKDQKAATELLPSDRQIVVERFKDELGDYRVCILTPFGGRVHAPWALAMEHVIGQRTGQEVQALWSDDGIALRFVASTDDMFPPGPPGREPGGAPQARGVESSEGAKAPSWDDLWIDPLELEDHLVERLGTSGLFSGIFRENAARALLLPRRSPDRRAPLWQQRLRAQSLLAAVRQHASFPIVLETYRTCLQDVFDLPALKALLEQIERREVRVHEVETEAASPFSRSLAFAYVAAYMYEYDNPVAERRAQALTLDRNLLRELLGHEELRDLFDQRVLDDVEAELQGLVAPWRAPDADRLHDLIRRLGASTVDELQARADSDVAGWVAALVQARRVVSMRVAGRQAIVAIEDVALYRDGLGAVPPGGLPESLLAPVERPIEGLVLRYAKCHAPFSAGEVARHLALPLDVVEAGLTGLRAAGRVVDGAFRPRGHGREWCEPEVLRRIRRRMLATLRREVEPVDAATFTRFLADWQGLSDPPAASPTRLLEVLARLEGLALPFSEWEARVLPARLKGFQRSQLDELLAMGLVVWVGRGSLGPKDGRVAFLRRESAAALVDADPAPLPSPLHEAIVATLEARGAVFLGELAQRAGAPLGDVTAALWDLVWRGDVTNDTLFPLRALRHPARARGQGIAGGAGRWSLVKDLSRGAPAQRPTERLLARVGALLERYGLIVKEVVDSEGVAGGFSGLFEVLRGMEDVGRVRRGYFVDGVAGAQLALPGVVDRLRAARDLPPRTWLVAATDPSLPHGTILPWPPTAHPDLAPRRQAGASIVVRDGHPVLWLAPKGTRLLTLSLMRDDDGAAIDVLRFIAPHVSMVTEVDGAPVRGSRWEPLFRTAGWVGDYKGMLPGPGSGRG
ncbi:MAG: DEAD/DEAH box helicase [Deltaproteobacteria bacterium]|nr:DEAD/DEAH box helicase [Deltaproteobacteria bacterium]